MALFVRTAMLDTHACGGFPVRVISSRSSWPISTASGSTLRKNALAGEAQALGKTVSGQIRLMDDKRQVECADRSRPREDGDNIGPHRTRDIVTDHRPSPALRFKHRYPRAMLMNGFDGR